MAFSFVNVIFIGLISLLSVNGDYWPGTTLNLQFIFLGRCHDYQSILQKSRDSLKDLKAEYNCLDVWTKFKNSFARKDPCKITLNDYNDFFAMVNSGPIVDKTTVKGDKPIHYDGGRTTNRTMFWSGTKVVSHDLSKVTNQYITMEDTLMGFLADGLSWCGTNEPPFTPDQKPSISKTENRLEGIDYEKCPSQEECKNEAPCYFWGGASREFAKNARGKVYVMVSGTNVDRKTKRKLPAYNVKSYFARYELPNIKMAKKKENGVTEFVIVIVNDFFDESGKPAEPLPKYRHKCLVDRLLSQGYIALRLEKSFKKFYGRYQDLIEKYQSEICGKGSLVDLKKAIEDKAEQQNFKKGEIKITCIDTAKDATHILCAKYPQLDKCQLKNLPSAMLTKRSLSHKREDGKMPAPALEVISDEFYKMQCA